MTAFQWEALLRRTFWTPSQLHLSSSTTIKLPHISYYKHRKIENIWHKGKKATCLDQKLKSTHPSMLSGKQKRERNTPIKCINTVSVIPPCVLMYVVKLTAGTFLISSESSCQTYVAEYACRWHSSVAGKRGSHVVCNFSNERWSVWMTHNEPLQESRKRYQDLKSWRSPYTTIPN